MYLRERLIKFVNSSSNNRSCIHMYIVGKHVFFFNFRDFQNLDPEIEPLPLDILLHAIFNKIIHNMMTIFRFFVGLYYYI